jgi:Ca2+-binding EF-hand superfamily protein
LEDKFLAHALINLQFFNANLRFKQTFAEYIFKSITSFPQFDATTKHLKALDTENTGKLTRSQLLEALRFINGIDYSEEQLDKLIA